MKIIVVEDDEGVSRLLKELLSQLPGMTVEFASSGAEGWWLLSDPARHFDLGIFDFKSPLVDGVGLLERVRATPNRENMPVIICTGLNKGSDTAKLAALHGAHCLAKPFKPGTLLDKITAIDEARKAARGETRIV